MPSLGGVRARATIRLLLGAVSATAARPRLWPVAITQLRRFAPRGWWRKPPFLPLVGRDLAAFRAEAMYGDRAAAPTPGDLVVWLEWCRAQGRLR